MPESKSLREWYKQLKAWQNPRVWRSASWRTIQWWIRQDVRSFAARVRRTLREATDNVQRYGSAIRKEYGVSRTRQFLHQCRLGTRQDVPAIFYYAYRLYLDEHWESRNHFIYDRWPLHIGLINRSFPEEKTLFDHKLRFFEHCREHKVPTPPIVAVYKDGVEQLFLDAPGLPDGDLFVKELEGSQGRGTEQFVFEGGQYRRSDGTTFTSKELTTWLEKQSRNEKALIVQPRVQNHPSWQPFTSGALATVRFLTGRVPDGSIEPLAATVRMPTGESVVDNFSAGGIAAAIDLSTGRLSPAISKLPQHGVFEFGTHPDTNRQIAGTQLPNWDEVRKLALDVHRTFDTIFVGWDLTLTPKGPAVIEGNKGWDPDVVEIPQGMPLAFTLYADLYDTWMRHFLTQD